MGSCNCEDFFEPFHDGFIGLLFVSDIHEGVIYDIFKDAIRDEMMISFGNASGVVPPVNLGVLAAKGSLQITRPTLFTHIAKHEDCQQMARHLFEKVTSGAVRIRIDQHFALEDVGKAHIALEARATTGATVLLP